MKVSEIKKILDSKKELPKLDKKSIDSKNGSEVLRQTSIYEYIKSKNKKKINKNIFRKD
tara:strand:+ start:303 stop:479 length:177 start_codon:yes stop_codon:yes gene_type:complete